jgi:hypothetical protein
LAEAYWAIGSIAKLVRAGLADVSRILLSYRKSPEKEGSVNVKKEYKTVNEALKMFGETPIEVPTKGSDKEKIEFLLNSYAEKLKAANPQFRMFKNNRQIPEMIVQYLVSVVDK